MGVEEEIYENTRVFKIIATHTITGEKRDHEMVNTFHDYEKRLKSHMYTPLLYQLNLKQRIAYLYGCLNTHFGSVRTEKFTVYSRVIGTTQWDEWFQIVPELDKV